MGNDSNIREKLKLVRLYNDKIEYELSYLLSQNCRTFTALKKIDIINYVNEYYVRKKQIDYDNLINDINVFKSYRDDVDINIRKESDFHQFTTIGIAIIAILLSIVKTDKIIKYIIVVLVLLAIVDYIYFRITTGSRSESYKLKVINNVIYTLETIKEDMDKNENSCEKYKAMKNKYSPRAMYERKRR